MLLTELFDLVANLVRGQHDQAVNVRVRPSPIDQAKGTKRN
jgi:hypothetical protein